MYTLEEFLQNKMWNPSIGDSSNGKKVLYMYLRMKPDITLDKIKISLNGHELCMEIDNRVSTDNHQYTSTYY